MSRYLILLFISFICTIPVGFAQETAVSIDQEVIDVDDFEQIRFARLSRIRKELVKIESQIYIIKKKNHDEDDMVLTLKFESELEALQIEYRKKKLLFIETMTGKTVGEQNNLLVESKKNLSDDFREILEPALNGIKAISERPRQIQKLQEQIKDYTEKIENTISAKVILVNKRELEKYKIFRRVLAKSIKHLEKIIVEYKIVLEDAQFKLIKLEKNKGSIVSVFSIMIFDFLKTKGKNLFLALSAFIFIFWFLARIKNKIINFLVNKVIRLSRPQDQSFWFIRPIKVLYSVFGFLFALSVGIMILYVMNDWVLVTFILFILGAAVWSSKHYFPVFFEQSKIVLNLGAIRENEVVIYNNIPWRLKSLGYYCRLENPTLTGGSLRISSKELMNYHSRPIMENEPWFPTRTKDWVVLSDDTYGQIVFQSPAQVVIKLIGGALKHLKVDTYLSLNPLNLSGGYGIEQVIGIDYQHQAVVLDELIPNFKKSITENLKAELKGEYEFIKEFVVEYKNAGASSLDIRFFLVCGGKIGHKKQILERKIQMGFVEVCNTHGYIIPFNQVTVHMPDGKKI